MDLTKTLKKDLLLLARSRGLKVNTHMTKKELADVIYAAWRKPDLLLLAGSLGLKTNTRMTKDDLISLCKPHLLKQESSPTFAKAKPEAKGAAEVKPQAAPKAAVKEPEIILPGRYNENRLVLMPVNPYMVYGYWEVTEPVIKGYAQKAGAGNYRLALHLFAIKDNGAPYVVQSTAIGAFGEYYFRHYLAGCTVWLELSLEDEYNNRYPVLYSLKTQMPMDHISESTEELYLTILQDGASRTLVFSGQGNGDGSDADELFLNEFPAFPKLGY